MHCSLVVPPIIVDNDQGGTSGSRQLVIRVKDKIVANKGREGRSNEEDIWWRIFSKSFFSE